MPRQMTATPVHARTMPFALIGRTRTIAVALPVTPARTALKPAWTLVSQRHATLTVLQSVQMSNSMGTRARA